jgi:hypothetical protein
MSEQTVSVPGVTRPSSLPSAAGEPPSVDEPPPQAVRAKVPVARTENTLTAVDAFVRIGFPTCSLMKNPA